jgi:hypothetical protein
MVVVVHERIQRCLCVCVCVKRFQYRSRLEVMSTVHVYAYLILDILNLLSRVWSDYRRGLDC